MRKLAVCLLSGGIDSAVATAMVAHDNWDVAPLNVEYGQRHARERDAARTLVAAMKWQGLRKLNLPLQDAYSALTGAMPIALSRNIEDMAKDIPATYVPMRNTMLMATACSVLESIALEQIEQWHNHLEAVGICIGANAVDYSGYPDCRPEFYKALFSALNLGSKIHTQYGYEIQLLTPVIGMTKAEVVTKGWDLNVPIGATWSCYLGGKEPCGKCDSCIIRDAAISEAQALAVKNIKEDHSL